MWLITFKESFDLGVMISSQSKMSCDWNNILKEEDTSIARLMTNSLQCTISIVQQLKVNFTNLEEIWNTFCEACPVLIDQYLKYLNQFKEVYLNPLIRNQSTSLPFKSPLVSSLILRYSSILIQLSILIYTTIQTMIELS